MRMSPPIDLCMCHLRRRGGNPFGHVAQGVKGPFLHFRGSYSLVNIGHVLSPNICVCVCVYIYSPVFIMGDKKQYQKELLLKYNSELITILTMHNFTVIQILA